MKRLLLVRHGETFDNRIGRIQGHRHGELTPEGIAQARALAARIASEKVDVILSSDLARASDTANILAGRHFPTPLLQPELRERCYGMFDGRMNVEFYAYTSQQLLPFHVIRPEGGESIADMIDRVGGFFRKSFEAYRTKNVLIVAHGHLNQALILTILKKPIEEWHALEQDNTCLNIFDFDSDGQVSSHVLNCTAHLSSADAGRSTMNSKGHSNECNG